MDGRIVAYASSCGVNHSPGFDSKSVVYRYSQTLLAANIAFGGLHRDVPEKKLDLLELAPRIMTEPRT
jgi:hypothetical protein